MINRNHPAVEAANRTTKRAYGSRGGEALNYHATALRAALPHLTTDDLRHTPAGRALMAEAWEECSDEFCKQGIVQVPANPYHKETLNE